jgi:hypothetical protein
VTDNAAPGAEADSGGVFVDQSMSLTLGASVVAGNSAGSGACTDLENSGVVTSAGNNLVGTACEFFAASGDQVGVDPQLGELGFHGGPTATIPPASADSPIINRGANPQGVNADQRGRTRPVPAGAGNTDVGAFELQAPVNTTSPMLSVAPKVGTPIKCLPGTWNTDGVTPSLTYTWSAGGIVVGHGQTYTPLASDRGSTLRCVETADNGATASSAATAQVEVGAAEAARRGNRSASNG